MTNNVTFQIPSPQPSPAGEKAVLKSAVCASEATFRSDGSERIPDNVIIISKLRDWGKNSKMLNRILTVLISIVLIFITLPFILIIPILIKLSGPGPIFYRGQRLGKNKKPFTMYKFRTLYPGAHQIIGHSLVKEGNKLITPIGNYLRETRLDELPQLINVLKGDMNLIGPRPERPEIYEDLCKTIPSYDLRFTVKPGVMGYSQLFTPHSSPKRLRSLIDRNYLINKRTQREEIMLLIKAISLLAKKGIATTWSIVNHLMNWITGKSPFEDRRSLRRIRVNNAIAYVNHKGMDFVSVPEGIQCNIINITKESILINSKGNLLSTPLFIRLEIIIPCQEKKAFKRKIVYCEGRKSAQLPSKEKEFFSYVIQIHPATPLNEYKYEKYFLKAALG